MPQTINPFIPKLSEEFLKSSSNDSVFARGQTCFDKGAVRLLLLQGTDEAHGTLKKML